MARVQERIVGGKLRRLDLLGINTIIRKLLILKIVTVMHPIRRLFLLMHHHHHPNRIMLLMPMKLGLMLQDRGLTADTRGLQTIIIPWMRYGLDLCKDKLLRLSSLNVFSSFLLCSNCFSAYHCRLCC